MAIFIDMFQTEWPSKTILFIWKHFHKKERISDDGLAHLSRSTKELQEQAHSMSNRDAFKAVENWSAVATYIATLQQKAYTSRSIQNASCFLFCKMMHTWTYCSHNLHVAMKQAITGVSDAHQNYSNLHSANDQLRQHFLRKTRVLMHVQNRFVYNTDGSTIRFRSHSSLEQLGSPRLWR
jgi:hypothetical protein